jgi:hypothetical protein
MAKKSKANVLEGRHDTKEWWKSGTTKRQAAPTVKVNSHGGDGAGHARGSLTRGRLDRRARGGKVTKKHPDVEVRVTNIRPIRRRGFQLGGAAPISAGRPPIAAARPVGLPAQANPAATAALAARPALPVQAQGTRPFSRGGRYW